MKTTRVTLFLDIRNIIYTRKILAEPRCSNFLDTFFVHVTHILPLIPSEHIIQIYRSDQTYFLVYSKTSKTDTFSARNIVCLMGCLFYKGSIKMVRWDILKCPSYRGCPSDRGFTVYSFTYTKSKVV